MQRLSGIIPAFVLAVMVALTACSTSSSSYGNSDGSGYTPEPPTLECDDVQASVLQRERVGDTAAATNGEMQFLMDNCPPEYDAVTGFIAAKIQIASSGFQPCEAWPSLVGEAATALLRAEGMCEDGAPAVSGGDIGANGQPGGGIPWSEAASYVGSTQRVCGPLRSQRPWQDSVFLNIGLDYPDPGRFAIVLWEVGSVEQLSPGVTICTEGLITSYEGVAQIELYDHTRVEIWE